MASLAPRFASIAVVQTHVRLEVFVLKDESNRNAGYVLSSRLVHSTNIRPRRNRVSPQQSPRRNRSLAAIGPSPQQVSRTKLEHPPQAEHISTHRPISLDRLPSSYGHADAT